MNDNPEDRNKPIHERGKTAYILGLADPARGDDDNEFEGHHCDASVSFIVV